jgi:hypothetical protein
VLSKDQFLAEVRKRAASDAEVGRILSLPSSRVAELFGGKRGLKYEEAVALAEHYGIDDGPQINAEMLTPILSACLRYAPKAGWSEQEAPRLAQAVEYGLALLANGLASPATPDALAVAGRAAFDRLREGRLAA